MTMTPSERGRYAQSFRKIKVVPRPVVVRLNGMPCGECGGHTEVKDSRPCEKGGVKAIRRRRKCVDCGAKITTWEMTKIAEDPRITRVRELVRDLQSALDELPPTAEWDDL